MITRLFELPIALVKEINLQTYLFNAFIGALATLPFIRYSIIEYYNTHTREHKIANLPAIIISYFIFVGLHILEIIAIPTLTKLSYATSSILFTIALASFGTWLLWLFGVRMTYPENETIEISIVHVIMILAILLYSIRFFI